MPILTLELAFLSTSPKKWVCSRNSIVALFLIIPNVVLETAQISITWRTGNQLCSVHVIKCYLTIERTSWLPSTTRMKLTDITLSERSWHKWRESDFIYTKFKNRQTGWQRPESRSFPGMGRGRRDWLGWTTKERPGIESSTSWSRDTYTVCIYGKVTLLLFT